MALKEVEDIVKKAKKSKGESTARAAELAVNNAKEETSKDVRQLSESKWQITGKSVEEIRALYENIDKVRERAVEMVKAAHSEMWALINQKSGTKDSDRLHIDTDHMKEGLIILEKKSDKDKDKGGTQIGGLGSLLRHIVEKHLED